MSITMIETILESKLQLPVATDVEDARAKIAAIIAPYPCITDADYDDDLFGELDELVKFYSAETCRPFAEDVHAAFPREIRDMIYTELIDSQPDAVKQIERMLRVSLSDVKYGTRGVDDLWILKPCFVGEHMGREILERLYYSVFAHFSCKAQGIAVLHGLATTDVFQSGFKPIHFVKKIDMRWVVGSSIFPSEKVSHELRDPQYWPDRDPLPTWRSCFESLRQIRDKSKFDMYLRIADRRLSLKHLGHLLETFRPVYFELVAAGAKIRISYIFLYGKTGWQEADLRGYYGEEREAWWEAFRQEREGWEKKERQNGGNMNLAPNSGWDDLNLNRYWDEEFDKVARSGLIVYP